MPGTVLGSVIALARPYAASLDHCMDDEFPDIASKITSVSLKDSNSERNLEVFIPENEKFRLLNIFQNHEYRILNKLPAAEPKVIVDVGANIGSYAIYAYLTQPNSRIYCFEPAPSTFRLLEKNTASLPSVERFEFGLSDHDAEPVLPINPLNTGENSLKSTRISHRGTRIRIRKASEVMSELGLESIDILKVDTEGCETEILASLSPLLGQIKFVLLEYHSEDDRRKIDALLGKRFYLFHCEANDRCLGVGTVKYVNAQLLGEDEIYKL